MSNRLPGKFAVITGAASGIGAATARLFAQEGARVAIFDTNGGAAGQLASKLSDSGFSVTASRCDVSHAGEVEQAIKESVARHGPIHILFNNAGIAIRRTVEDQDEESWDRVIGSNLKGAYLCSKFALPHFAAEGGVVIHTSSVTGIVGVRDRAAYSAAKAGLIGLTRNMALDYARRNIRVNAICPGFVRTPFIGAILADEDRARRLTALHPLGRLGEPEDIARAALFLSSDEASWITGHALVVDGGFSTGHAVEI